MRRTLLGIIAILFLFSGSAWGQRHQSSFTDVERFNGTVSTQHSEPGTSQGEVLTPLRYNPHARATYDVIWYEDFSGGLPAGWINTGSTSGANTATWEYRGPSTTPDITQGSRGSCAGIDVVESPTASNGFFIFDSNWYDDPGSVCGGAVGSGLVPNPHSSYMQTHAIDCSQYPTVLLEWYQTVRHFSAIPAVLVSSDSGATFDTVYDARDFYNPNQRGPLADYVSLDVSNLVGGKTNVVVKFSWSPSNRIPAFNGYYYWMIDDIRLVEKPRNDLAILSPRLGYITGVNFDDKFGNYYYIPKQQVSQITFDAVVQNKGTVNQPNVKTNFTVTGPTPYNQTSPSLPLLAVDSFALQTNTANPYMPSQVGAHTVLMTVSSDSVDVDPDPFRPNNNTYTTDFEISDSIFGTARPGVSTAVIGTHSQWSVGGQTVTFADGIALGNLIELSQADTITSVSIGLSVISRPDGAVRISIRDTAGDMDIVILETDFYSITLQDSLNNFATILIPDIHPLTGFPQDRILPAGWYYVVVEMYSSGNTFNVGLRDDGSVPQSAFMSMMFLPGQGWFTNGTAHHIWANFGKRRNVGIQEIPNVQVTLNPNPANESVQFGLIAEKASTFNVVITNISGQVVKAMTFNSTNRITETINVSDLSAGVYFVQVKSDDNSMTRKLVISR